ncbi:hypothetical protein L6V77_27265, partial [Myxococcota bacterium]|nr:hypothetical protein [Myxococcota bacterium]
SVDGGPADVAVTPDVPAGPLCAGHPIIDLNDWFADNPAYDGTTEDALATLAASCGGAAGGELVFQYRVREPLDRLVIRTDFPETTAPTVVYVRTECEVPDDLACNRGSPAQPGTRVTLEAPTPGLYYIVVDQGARDAPGAFRLAVEANAAAACRDTDDNDGDGLVDLADPGCLEAADESEIDPDVVPECADGLDNDGNGSSDYPADPQCTAAGVAREGPLCALELPVIEVGMGGGVFPTDFATAGVDLAQGRCNFEAVPEVLFVVSLDREANVQVINRSLQMNRTFITFFARRVCEDGATEIGCGDPFTGTLGLQALPAGDYFVFAEPSLRAGIPVGAAVSADIEFIVTPTRPTCSDAVDNDRDGLTDLDDPGCRDARDEDETDPVVRPFCANGQDDDGDGAVDFPGDDGCTGAGDACEGVGDDLCDGQCQDVQSNVAHCGRCGRACDPGVPCIEGRCGALRSVVMLCGGSGRNPQEFIRGDLAEAEVRVAEGCVPDGDTQALLVTRGGNGQFRQNLGVIRPWLEDGGQVLTEYNIAHDIYNAVFNANVPQGNRNGGCQDNVQPAVQLSPEDPFWQDNIFAPVPNNATGCGHAIRGDLIPDFVPLGGWDANNVSLGYVDVAGGRLWLVEADWQDSEAAFTDTSRDLMAYMIAGGRAAAPGVACANGRDDDRDGLRDLADPGCADAADGDEADPPAPPACANGVDDDRDGRVDFPAEPGCGAAGDDDEADPDAAPACANGRDDDGDGRQDYPLDPGCDFAGDETEVAPARVPGCANGVDDDGDGRTDYPDDLDCTHAADTSEVGQGEPPPRCADTRDNDLDGLTDAEDTGCESPDDDDETDPDPAGGVLAFCANGADDDGDGAIDWPADDGCAAAGDPCEEAGFIQCNGACYDGRADPANCGACGNACAEGVECIDGFCGGLYYVAGIQTNLPEATMNGWRICHRDTYGSVAPLDGITAACNGRYTALACRPQGAVDFTVLAMGETAEVFTDTGDQNNVVHEHNGVNWYYSRSWSMGFIPVGTVPSRNSCDTNNDMAEQRLCWHTGGGNLNPGWRCGAQMPGDWERVIYTAQ